MASVRLIPRLDVKGSNLIKTIQLEGLRVMGDPQEFAQRYYLSGADELIYIDLVASLYGRENLIEIVRHTTKNVFIPLTAGGGIRTIDDVQALLEAGADKVALNTAATTSPDLLRHIAERFGSQCVVLSIEAICQSPGKWSVLSDCGREQTGLDAVEWAKRGVELGAGEILLTSINQEGTFKGYDIELTQAVRSAVDVPIIASGGMGKVEHMIDAIIDGGADAVAMAGILHYDRMHLNDIRKAGIEAGLRLRTL